VDIYDRERYEPNRKLIASQDLLRICPGLIDIQTKSLDGDGVYADSMAPIIEIVYIAHFSVQEYLLLDRIKHGRVSSFAVSSATGHLQISKSCLIYLCNEDFLGQPLISDYIE
jgi:hypothetical protein